MRQKSCVEIRENVFVTKAAIDLAELIRTRKVTAQDVIQAYINRLDKVSDKISNCTYCRLINLLINSGEPTLECRGRWPICD